jgi:phosphoglycolate phosphatase
MSHAVFDLDGTLVDSVPIIARILSEMLAERGSKLRATHDTVRPHATAGGLAMVRAILGEVCGDEAAALTEFRRRYATSPTPKDSLYPGVREGLDRLSRGGATLAVWSNKPQYLCEKVLVELGLAESFAAIVGTSAEIPLKPDPKGLDLVLTQAGGSRSSACYIGDSEIDYLAAKRAGVPCVIVSYGYGDLTHVGSSAGRANDFAEATACVEDILGLGATRGLSAGGIA